MAEVTAAAVNELRKKTGLPMMDVKKALHDAAGNEDEAIRLLRERGLKILGSRLDRETSFGRFGLYIGLSASTGAMVELKCESAPVAANEEFIQRRTTWRSSWRPDRAPRLANNCSTSLRRASRG